MPSRRAAEEERDGSARSSRRCRRVQRRRRSETFRLGPSLHREGRHRAGFVDRQVRQDRGQQASGALGQPAERPAGQGGDHDGPDDRLALVARVRDVPQPEYGGLQQPPAAAADGSRRATSARRCRSAPGPNTARTQSRSTPLAARCAAASASTSCSRRPPRRGLWRSDGAIGSSRSRRLTTR